MIAALFDLLAGIGQALAILLALHALAQLVGVAQDLLLLLAKPLELALELLAGLRVLGRLEGGLKLLQTVVQVGLALGQLTKPAGDLAVLGLLALSL